MNQQYFNTKASVLSCQLIALGLIFGAVSLIVISYFVIPVGNLEEGQQPLFSYIAAGLSAAAVFLSTFVPALVSQALIRKKQSEVNQSGQGLLEIYQIRLTVLLAIIEQAVVFNCVAYMLENQIWSLGIAIVLTLLLMSFFPFRSQVENWVKEQKELLELQQMS